jgi:hypothetical protein
MTATAKMPYEPCHLFYPATHASKDALARDSQRLYTMNTGEVKSKLNEDRPVGDPTATVHHLGRVIALFLVIAFIVVGTMWWRSQSGQVPPPAAPDRNFKAEQPPS